MNDEERIREMAESDIEKVLEIERQSFVSPWTNRMFEETITSPISMSFTIEIDSLLLGYIMSYLVENEAHIMNLAIHPDHRGKGCASRLVRHTINYCEGKGVSEFFLEVRESNINAKNLYRKLGFEVIGRRKRYYSETNEDALVMQLSLH